MKAKNYFSLEKSGKSELVEVMVILEAVREGDEAETRVEYSATTVASMATLQLNVESLRKTENPSKRSTYHR